VTFPAALTVTFRPGTSASFGNVLTLGDPLNGVLGSNVLGTSAAVPVNITADVRQVAIRRGRDRQFDTYTSGTCTVELIDTNGDWNPDNTSSPYFGEIKPGRQLRISAAYNSISAFLFSGYITRYQWRWEPELDANIVTISANDGFRILEAGQITTVAGAADGDTAGERIDHILAAAAWPASLRDISVGGITLQADPGEERTPLAACQQVELSDIGSFLIRGDGVAQFRTRADNALQATQTATVFTDDPNPIGPVVRYKSIDVALDDSEIVNQVSAERIDGTPQVFTDSGSATEFFTRARSFTSLLHQTDAQSLNLAKQVVNYRSQPALEIRSVSVEMISNDTPRITAGLTLKIGDPIVVERSAVGGTVSSALTVQGVSHNIRLGSWDTTFSTAEPLGFAFVLGSPQYGVLGVSTL
jgi:hypothetical protein